MAKLIKMLFGRTDSFLPEEPYLVWCTLAQTGEYD